MTTIESFNQYMRYELNRSAHTVSSYSTDLIGFATFVTGGKPDTWQPADTTSNDIRAWLAALSRSGVKASSIRRKTQALRAFFRWMRKRGGIAVNPAADVTLAKLSKPLPDSVPVKEMETLLDEDIDSTDFCQVRDHMIVNMLYSTGIRRAELLDLRLKDYTPSARELKVTGKRDKQRVIPISPQLATEIERYLEMRADTAAEGTDAFFLGKNGRPLNKTALSGIVKVKLAMTSCSKRSPHTLRHTFATAMLNNGAEINAVKEFLGHASLATTQIYTHLSYNELKNNYLHAHPRAKKEED